MDAPSPSESSELRALMRASEEIGSGAGAEVSCSLDTEVSRGLDTFCRFFGCGSMVDDTLCLERTGTGIVFREASRPDGMLAGLSGFGLGSDMRTGLGTPTGFMDGWSLSM